MDLDLTVREKNELVLILENYIPDLKHEILSTTKKDWKEEMEKEEEILIRILNKLNRIC